MHLVAYLSRIWWWTDLAVPKKMVTSFDNVQEVKHKVKKILGISTSAGNILKSESGSSVEPQSNLQRRREEERCAPCADKRPL